MGKNYDNWGRLVEAVVRREQLRSLSLADSRSPSIRSIDSDYSFSSTSTSTSSQNLSFTSPQLKFGKHRGTNKVLAKTRNAVWKGLSIFRGFSSKENEKEEREAQWAKAHKTLHGIDQLKSSGYSTKQNNEVVFPTNEMWKGNAEVKRLRELYTLKGHIEALAKTRGIDLDSIHHYYTV